MNVRRTTILLAATLLLLGCPDKKAGPAGAASAQATGTTTLKPQATPIKAGQSFTVAFTGPNGADDYIDVVAAGHPQVGDEMAAAKTALGNPAKLTAPGSPGTYDVRYVQSTGNRTILARASITVVP